MTLDKILSKDGELDKYVPQRDDEVVYKGEMDEIAIDQTLKYLVLKSKATPANPAGELMIIRIYQPLLCVTVTGHMQVSLLHVMLCRILLVSKAAIPTSKYLPIHFLGF